MDLVDVPGVEIYGAGTWHGEKVSNAYIAQMLRDNMSILPYFRAKLKLTHHFNQPGILKNASFGRVTRFYTRMRDGLLRLYVDFERVPAVIAKAVRYFFTERSVEIPFYTVHPKTGEVLTDIISAIAFLGSTPPEVKGMLDEYAAIYEQGTGSRLQKDALPQFFSQAEPVVYTISMNPLAIYVKARREELKLTIENLAEATGLAVDMLTQIEAGAAMPSDDELTKLATALQVEGGAEYLKALTADQGDAGAEDPAQQKFEQGVKAAAKMFEQQISDLTSKHNSLLQRMNFLNWLDGMKAKGLAAVFTGSDMVEFLGSLEQTNRKFSAEGQEISQVAYMQSVLEKVAQLIKVPTGESDLGKQERQVREYEQTGSEVDQIIASIKADKKCSHAEALIEASRRRRDLFKM